MRFNTILMLWLSEQTKCIAALIFIINFLANGSHKLCTLKKYVEPIPLLEMSINSFGLTQTN